MIFIAALGVPAMAAPDKSAVTKTPAVAEPLKASTQEALFAKDFPGLTKKISLDIKGMSIVDFLKFLAVEGNMNVAIAQDVAGSVNLLVNDVSISDILKILFSTNNLAYQVQGNVIKIISSNEYKIRQGVDFNDTTGLLVLVDTPQKIEEMDAVVKKSDISTIARVLPTETEVFELNYAKVDAIQAEVTAALTTNVGTIRTDVRTNTFVITDLPHKLAEIGTVLKALDRKTREVFIEAKIIQVTLSDTFKWGIDWDRLFTAGQAGGISDFSITPESSLPLGLDDTFGKLAIARTGTNALNFVLEAL